MKVKDLKKILENYPDYMEIKLHNGLVDEWTDFYLSKDILEIVPKKEPNQFFDEDKSNKIHTPILLIQPKKKGKFYFGDIKY